MDLSGWKEPTVPVRYMRYETPGWRDPSAALPPAMSGEIRDLFMPPQGCLLLAYDPDAPQNVVGSAGYTRIGPGVCEARRVVVGWAHQRKGIGRGLMDALVAEARREGYRTMHAAAPSNVPALVSFFERLGFRRMEQDGLPRATVCFEATLGSLPGDGR